MSPTQTLGPSTGLRTANDHPSQHRLQALGEKGPNDLELARSICSLSGTRWWGSEKIVYKHSFFFAAAKDETACVCFEILETAWLQIADFSIQGTLPVSQASAVETGAPKQPVEPFTPGKTRLTSLKMTLKIHQFSESVKLSTVFFCKGVLRRC